MNIDCHQKFSPFFCKFTTQLTTTTKSNYIIKNNEFFENLKQIRLAQNMFALAYNNYQFNSFIK